MMLQESHNPYSAPTAEPLPQQDALHREFQLTEKGIRCRTQLELPKICLVSGRTDDLVLNSVRLIWMPMFSRVVIYLALLFLLIAFALNYVLVTYVIPDPAVSLDRIQYMMWLIIACRVIFWLALFCSLAICQTGVLMTFVHTTVHLTLRKRAYALAAIACGVGFALFLLTREYHPGRHSQAIVILAAGVTLLVAGGWAWEFRRESVVNLPGASLKVVSYQSGKFEIAGFTLEYLESLRKYRRTSDP